MGKFSNRDLTGDIFKTFLRKSFRKELYFDFSELTTEDIEDMYQNPVIPLLFLENENMEYTPIYTYACRKHWDKVYMVKNKEYMDLITVENNKCNISKFLRDGVYELLEYVWNTVRERLQNKWSRFLWEGRFLLPDMDRLDLQFADSFSTQEYLFIKAIIYSSTDTSLPRSLYMAAQGVRRTVLPDESSSLFTIEDKFLLRETKIACNILDILMENVVTRTYPTIDTIKNLSEIHAAE